MDGDHIKPQMPLGRRHWSLQHQESIMAVGQGSRQAADEEARAEVEVLNSRLEKTRILNSKLTASLQRLKDSGRSVQDAIGPLAGNTNTLRTTQNNIDQILKAIEKIRKPSVIQGNVEEILRRGPKAGLSQFLSAVEEVDKSLADLQKTNLLSNKQIMEEYSLKLRKANALLEIHFKEILKDQSKRVEPSGYIMKKQPFPTIMPDSRERLNQINRYMVNSSRQSGGSPMIQFYAEVRGPYLTETLATLASASLNSAKKKNQDDIYKAGTNTIGSYIEGMELAFIAEYDNICRLFRSQEWSQAFNLTTQGAISELRKTLQDLNSHIRANLTTDCFLAYEIVDLMSNMSSRLEEKTGELKTSFTVAVKPIRETGKSSLAELLDDTRRRIANLPTIPADAAAIPITRETMIRLQTMANFLGPVSSIMISIGDGGWKASASSQSTYSTDQVPSLNSFDVSADGRKIFAHYCVDTISTLLESLDRKAQPLAKNRSAHGVFMLNNTAVIERMITTSTLQALIEPRNPEIEKWEKKSTKEYTNPWQDVCRQLMDTINTNRGQRPPSGSAAAIDSTAILKGMSSKEKDATKEKFRVFNTMFDDLVQKHRAMSMEQEVKQSLAQNAQQMVEPLYHRFWDRYHEIDKGKGKYVKYDKAAMTAIFVSLGA